MDLAIVPMVLGQNKHKFSGKSVNPGLKEFPQ